MAISSTPQDNTVDEENNGTREDSTTQSEDRYLKMLSKNRLTNSNILLIDSPDDEFNNKKLSNNFISNFNSNFPLLA
jgi:hypothetical protein